MEWSRAVPAYRNITCIHTFATHPLMQRIFDLFDDINDSLFLRLILNISASPPATVAFSSVSDASV